VSQLIPIHSLNFFIHSRLHPVSKEISSHDVFRLKCLHIFSKSCANKISLSYSLSIFLETRMLHEETKHWSLLLVSKNSYFFFKFVFVHLQLLITVAALLMNEQTLPAQTMWSWFQSHLRHGCLSVFIPWGQISKVFSHPPSSFFMQSIPNFLSSPIRCLCGEIQSTLSLHACYSPISLRSAPEFSTRNIITCFRCPSCK
jgi:hypothetical protein